MKILSLSLTAFALSGFAFLANADELFELPNGEPPNHLVPTEGFDQRSIDHLSRGGSIQATMIICPSYGGEAVFELVVKIAPEVLKKYHDLLALIPNSEKTFYIRSAVAKKSLRSNPLPLIEQHELEVSVRLASSIQRAWGNMLMLTRYPEKAYIGNDGLTIQFGASAGNLGFLRGEIWSPELGLPAEIAAFGEKLMEIATKEAPLEKAQEDELVAKLDEFTTRAEKERKAIAGSSAKKLQKK